MQGDEAFVRQDFAASAEAYAASLRHDTGSAPVWANRAAALLRLGVCVWMCVCVVGWVWVWMWV